MHVNLHFLRQSANTAGKTGVNTDKGDAGERGRGGVWFCGWLLCRAGGGHDRDWGHSWAGLILNAKILYVKAFRTKCITYNLDIDSLRVQICSCGPSFTDSANF